MTCGVIHPAQTLSRGNTAASATTTSSPSCRNARAHDDPAGPPPTISTSHMSMNRPSQDETIARVGQAGRVRLVGKPQPTDLPELPDLPYLPHPPPDRRKAHPFFSRVERKRGAAPFRVRSTAARPRNGVAAAAREQHLEE